MNFPISRRVWITGCAGRHLAAARAPLSESQIRALLRTSSDFYAQGRVHASVRTRITSESGVDPAAGPVSQYTLHRSGTLLHLDDRQVLHVLYIVGKDRIWHYRFEQRQYVVSPLEGQRAEEIKKTGRDWFQWYVDCFVLLSKFDSEVEFLRWQDVRRGRSTHRCAVIRLKANDPSQSWWQERLWIELDTGVVWRVVRHYKGGTREGAYYSPGTSTIEWDFVTLGEPPDPGLFVFHPPKGARQVRQFSPFTVYG